MAKDKTGIFIDKLSAEEQKTMTCDAGFGISWRKEDLCCEWATWYVGTGFYCDKHKEAMVQDWQKL